MNRNREKFSARALVIPVAFVAAFCISTAAHAQRSGSNPTMPPAPPRRRP